MIFTNSFGAMISSFVSPKCPGLVSPTTNHTSRQRTSMRSVIEHERAVYENVQDACRILRGIFKCGVVLYAVGIEDNNIGIPSRFEQSSFFQVEVGCRQ